MGLATEVMYLITILDDSVFPAPLSPLMITDWDSVPPDFFRAEYAASAMA
jgi:hypothetical protein